MERGTDYGLEQVFHVIDSRYRSGKPLIVTTNLTLDELKNPTDTAHSRIYDRLLSMCVPIRFTGVNFRQESRKRKMETLKKLMVAERSIAYGDIKQHDHRTSPPPRLRDGNPHGYCNMPFVVSGVFKKDTRAPPPTCWRGYWKSGSRC